MKKLFLLAFVCLQSVFSFASSHEKLYIVCDEYERFLTLTNDSTADGIRHSSRVEHISINGKAVTNEQINNPGLLKGCTYRFEQFGSYILISIETADFKKNKKKKK